MSLEKTKKTVFITGVTGFVGSHLAERMSEEFIVKGLSRKKGKYSTVIADLSNIENIDLSGVDVVVHLATAFQGDKNIREINVEATRKILESAKKSSVKRFIFASTGGVFKRSDKVTIESPYVLDTDYARTKKEAGDLVLQEKNIDVCVAYLFFPYGPGQADARLIPRMIGKIKRGEEISINRDGGPKMSYTYIDDLTEQIYRLCAIERVPKETIIAGESAPLEKVIRIISNIVGKKAVVNRIQNEADFVGIESIHKFTKYVSSTPLEEGLKKTIATLR